MSSRSCKSLAGLQTLLLMLYSLALDAFMFVILARTLFSQICSHVLWIKGSSRRPVCPFVNRWVPNHRDSLHGGFTPCTAVYQRCTKSYGWLTESVAMSVRLSIYLRNARVRALWWIVEPSCTARNASSE